jgi:hypothetical protein
VRALGRAIWWHPWLLTAGLSLLVLATGVRGTDLPAADLRTWLVREHGFVVWNDQWYGGHPTVGYSLLFPLLGSVAGVRIAGVLSAVVAAIAATKIVDRNAGTWVRVGLLWFCVTIVTEVIIGQLPFLLGVAFATWAVHAVRRGHPWLAALAAAGCSLASPLAGGFLLLGALAWATTGRWRAASPFSAATVGLGLAAVAGGGGTFPMPVVQIIPIAVLVSLGLYLTPPAYVAVRRCLVLYGAVGVLMIFVPTPVGGNITRFGALVAGPVAVALLIRMRRAVWLALSVIPLLAWPGAPAVASIAHSGVDPSRHESYFAGLVTYLGAHATPYGRVEVPMTRDHWEAAYLASHYPIARGWERQIDLRYNPLFYDDELLTATSYQEWLRDNAVRYVALPDVTLDRAGNDEAKLLRSGKVADLRPVWSDEHWRVWQVVNPEPFVSGDGQLNVVGVDSFTLWFNQPGTTLVRLHYSRMWHSPDPNVCISASPSGWTQITSAATGEVTIAAKARLAALVPIADNGLAKRPACAAVAAAG